MAAVPASARQDRRAAGCARPNASLIASPIARWKCDRSGRLPIDEIGINGDVTCKTIEQLPAWHLDRLPAAQAGADEQEICDLIERCAVTSATNRRKQPFGSSSNGWMVAPARRPAGSPHHSARTVHVAA